MSLSGATEGTASQLSNIAANDVLPMEGQIASTAMPAWQSYAQYLNQITSQDPSLRTQAAAPAIAQTNAQSKQAENQIRQLPRGGEQNYMLAQNDQSKAGTVSNFLNKEFTQGETAKGQFGSEGIAKSLLAISDIGQLDSVAAQIDMGQQQINAQNWQAIVGALTSVGEIAAGGGGG
jgi:hypothetical protein